MTPPLGSPAAGLDSRPDSATRRRAIPIERPQDRGDRNRPVERRAAGALRDRDPLRRQGSRAPAVERWPFLGRSRELAALAGLSEDESTDTVLVSGAPGVGKSRLAEEYLAAVTAQGSRAVRVMARPEESAVPFGAMASLLPQGMDPMDPVPCFARASRVLRATAGRTLVVVDDVHWLDQASAVLLRQLLDAGVVRVVATSRAGLPGSKASDALVRAGKVVRQELSALEERAVEDILEASLGHHVGKGCVRRLFTVSGGNARALRERVLGALDSGQLVLRDGVWNLVGTPHPGPSALSGIDEDTARSGRQVAHVRDTGSERQAPVRPRRVSTARTPGGTGAVHSADLHLRLAAEVLGLTEAGRLPEARAAGRAAFDRLLVGGPPDSRGWMATLLGRVEWLAGRVVDARRWFREALSGAAPAQGSDVQRIALSGAAACYAVAGDVASARTMLTRPHPGRDPRAGLLAAAEGALGQAWSSAAQGRVAAARDTLIAAAADARVASHPGSEALLLTEAARLGGAHEVLGLLDLNAARCEGRLTTARLSFVHALASDEPPALIAAADELRDLGALALAAEAYTAASASLRRSGRTREATSAGRLAATARASCQGLSTPLLGHAAPARSLTDREREIARLAARGTTSKDIATALFLSVRTVDNHLQRVYQKLGVSSRQELQRLMGT
ncbi:LuxR C-terminal-related transcriptional regulator [Streptomyces sp. NPDC049040]|uniref:helix-turn-helix transcriptional regulator n=1 Tax=Streptomyces sp. NPDC049040 TaxID=3365593 RepID=UPI00371A260A